MRELRSIYRRMSRDVATFSPLFGRWSANSQYGFTLEWLASRADAEKHVFEFYCGKANLLRQ